MGTYLRLRPSRPRGTCAAYAVVKDAIIVAANMAMLMTFIASLPWLPARETCGYELGSERVQGAQKALRCLICVCLSWIEEVQRIATGFDVCADPEHRTSTNTLAPSSPDVAGAGDRATKSTFTIIIQFGGRRPQARFEEALSGFDARTLSAEPLPARLVNRTEPGKRQEARIREFVNVLSKAGAEIVSARLNPGAQPHLVGCARSCWQGPLRGRTRCQQHEGGANHQNDLYHRLSHLSGGITVSALSYVGTTSVTIARSIGMSQECRQ